VKDNFGDKFLFLSMVYDELKPKPTKGRQALAEGLTDLSKSEELRKDIFSLSDGGRTG